MERCSWASFSCPQCAKFLLTPCRHPLLRPREFNTSTSEAEPQYAGCKRYYTLIIGCLLNAYCISQLVFFHLNHQILSKP